MIDSEFCANLFNLLISLSFLRLIDCDFHPEKKNYDPVTPRGMCDGPL